MLPDLYVAFVVVQCLVKKIKYKVKVKEKSLQKYVKKIKKEINFYDLDVFLIYPVIID